MKKRISALLLGTALCFSLFSTAYAANDVQPVDHQFGSAGDNVIISTGDTVQKIAVLDENGKLSADDQAFVSNLSGTVTITDKNNNQTDIGNPVNPDPGTDDPNPPVVNPPSNNNGSSSSGTSGTSSPALRPLPDRNGSGSSNTTPPTTVTNSFFTDVPANHWAVSAIYWVNANGYMQGVSTTSFQPESSITRQAVWMILARLSGASPANMAEARTWAINNGISDGTNPTTNMSRQQMVAFLYRYCQLKGYTLSGSTSLSGFPDSANVADYAQEALSWAVGNSIVAGTTQGTLNPTGTATRAQFAVILQRFYNGIVNA